MSRVRKVGKEYLSLVERFPLRLIHNDAELDAALAVMRELAYKGREATRDESDYLAVLEHLIARYEEERLPPLAEPMTPHEALRYLMEQNQLTQSQLATEIGADQGNISTFLAGKRSLSKRLASKLASRFCVSVDLFIEREGAAVESFTRTAAQSRKRRVTYAAPSLPAAVKEERPTSYDSRLAALEKLVRELLRSITRIERRLQRS